ncbi:hypothetical protein BRC61_04815 [Halobacteriales archaeon QH_10_65_19]|jgi:hypothetical protein|nr:MAG: hypothetical protein BRC61_04815 [Halobacteriales archaeon QH_10_65_19]
MGQTHIDGSEQTGSRTSRRQLLGLVAGAGAASLAGCSNPFGGGSNVDKDLVVTNWTSGDELGGPGTRMIAPVIEAVFILDFNWPFALNATT